MPRKPTQRQQLLNQAKERQRATGNKLSRLRTRGADVTGIDPRRPASEVAGYSAGRLRTYIRRLNSFTDRSNGYVIGAGGTPIPRAEWNAYKATERAYNKGAGAFNNAGRSYEPAGGVGEFYAKGGASKIMPLQAPRTPDQVTGPESLRALREDLVTRQSQGYMDSRVGKVRETINKLVSPFGDKDFLDAVSNASDFQLSMMWEFTQLASKLGLRYEGRSGNESGMSQRAQDKISDDSAEEARDIFNRGIATYPREAPIRPRGKKA